jgi:hypothetical protein
MVDDNCNSNNKEREVTIDMLHHLRPGLVALSARPRPPRHGLGHGCAVGPAGPAAALDRATIAALWAYLQTRMYGGTPWRAFCDLVWTVIIVPRRTGFRCCLQRRGPTPSTGDYDRPRGLAIGLGLALLPIRYPATGRLGKPTWGRATG